jgi:hypothetical protein
VIAIVTLGASLEKIHTATAAAHEFIKIKPHPPASISMQTPPSLSHLPSITEQEKEKRCGSAKERPYIHPVSQSTYVVPSY